MKNQLRDLNEPVIEYITIDRRNYDIMQLELNFLKNGETVDAIIKKVENKEGIIFFYNDLYPRTDIGFITSKSLEGRLNKFIELHNKFEKLPKFIKWLITKN